MELNFVGRISDIWFSFVFLAGQSCHTSDCSKQRSSFCRAYPVETSRIDEVQCCIYRDEDDWKDLPETLGRTACEAEG